MAFFLVKLVQKFKRSRIGMITWSMRRMLAAPAPVTEISPNKLAIREAAGVGLATAKIGCKIVNSSSPVNCRESPSLSAPVAALVYPGHWYNFYCWSPGSDVENNHEWDWNGDLGCYVSGYYTDGHCTASTLENCDDF
ncbi:hypothetical protein N431DRAFT_460128 [Stipitochalara longipes BDJ]|nr:hypothetical protein N431DRAFT_460128 [Stipitochalara longipes BDJ]